MDMFVEDIFEDTLVAIREKKVHSVMRKKASSEWNEPSSVKL